MANCKAWFGQKGVSSALGAALLFGAGTPLAKLLLASVNPWLLAGFLYLGSGAGLSLYRLLWRIRPGRLEKGEWPWLAGAIVAGGILAPVLLMLGLKGMPASGTSLLLNAEGVFTSLLAWIVFRENFDRRIALGMLAIVGGALVLSWPVQAKFASLWPAVAILGACVGWAVDNNLTRKVSLSDATWIAAIKGWVAGSVNLCIAISLSADFPSPPLIVASLGLGSIAYGASLTLFVLSLRQLGTARTGAYFSVAPFFGAALAVPLLGEVINQRLITAGALMAFGVWLHLTERHAHKHHHEPMEHEHEHTHDEHHRHEHDAANTFAERHTHRHKHAPLTHFHAHFPDMHHQHKHR
jgi:drug/metabolite transporter (DMT)-like permease